MLKDLISLANNLDEKGLRAEADYLDKVINKMAGELGEPTNLDEWEKQNPEPMWNEERFDNHKDAYEGDSEYKERWDGWDADRADWIEENYERMINKKEEEVKKLVDEYFEYSLADYSDELHKLTSQLKSLVDKRDAWRDRRERELNQAYGQWFYGLSEPEQEEHAWIESGRDLAEMYRDEY